MIPDSAIIQGYNDQRIRLVRGCPCMKEFGGERVCINDDDVIPVKTMVLDPQFFAQLCSVNDLQDFKSNREDMCYSLINLNPDADNAICLSQGKVIRINKKTIRATNIEEGLDFAINSDVSGNEAICSSCLYKYLVTLTDLFDNLLSEEEKGQIILSYSQDLINSIAAQLSQEVLNYNRNDILSNREIIEMQIERLANTRKRLGTKTIDSRSPDINETFEVLLRVHKTLLKLESIFLFQVLSLQEADDELTALTLLKFMVETADRILSTHNDIRAQRSALINLGVKVERVDELLEERKIHHKHAEKRIRNLLSILSKVNSRPT